MPVRIAYVQARRITCDLCERNFIYLLGGVTGTPLHGKTWMTAAASVLPFSPRSLAASFGPPTPEEIRTAELELPALAHMDFIGEALCPHCEFWQPWMYITGGTGRARPLLYSSPFIALIPVAVMLILAPETKGLGGVIWIGLTTLLMLAISRWASRPRAPKTLLHGGDPRALTDAEFEELVAACRVDGVGPLTKWAQACGLAGTKHPIFMSIGLLDLTGEEKYPDLATARKLAHLSP